MFAFPAVLFPLQLIFKVYKSSSAKSLQLCLTLCDPTDGSPPGSPVPGILQERTLEWAAISFSSAWKWKVEVKSLSHVQLLAIPWTAAYQAPPSMGFSRQEYRSGVPLPSLINLLNLHLFNFAYLLFLSLHLNIFVSFVFITLFPSWHLGLILFSSLCFA